MSSIKSIMFISVMFSLMVAITSLITHSGVDAPAATPILLYFAILCNGKSSIFSTKYTFLQVFFAISANFCVFELFFPPTTMKQSHIFANFIQLFWRSVVAPQMVLWILACFPSERNTALTSSSNSLRIVV